MFAVRSQVAESSLLRFSMTARRSTKEESVSQPTGGPTLPHGDRESGTVTDGATDGP